MTKILFTADLHGNKDQYKALVQNSKKYEIIIIGGDLTPKDSENRSIEKQRTFIKEFLNPLLSEMTSKVIMLMGNDDFRYNEDLLIQNRNISYASNGSITIGEMDFFCYSYVPLTPFKYKDWEKIEFDGTLEKNKERDFISAGVISKTGKFTPKNISLESKDSIYGDLSSKIHSRSILISHAPPFNTFADTMQNKTHVGSKAIRKVIEERQPMLTLHGHIHESVDITGNYTDMIGKTKVISVGNYHTTPFVFGVEIELNETIKTKRVKLEKDKTSL